MSVCKNTFSLDSKHQISAAFNQLFMLKYEMKAALFALLEGHASLILFLHQCAHVCRKYASIA